MPCFSPLQGWMSSKVRSKTGNPVITFSLKDGYVDRPMQVPCGQCIGCREKRAADWAVRISNEASLFSNNIFMTLTYKDMPKNASLDKKHLQDFFKRLRKHYLGIQPMVYEGKTTYPIRYYACGEYGSEKGRPHYHVILFNFDFPDKEQYYVRNGHQFFRSDILDDIWGLGRCDYSDVTYASARYVARYVNKKITGPSAEDYYYRVNDYTGEFYQIVPEFSLMSRRPGIGNIWIKQFFNDVYPQDKVILSSEVFARPPRYYDAQYELANPDGYANVKESRKLAMVDFSNSVESSPQRLRVKEVVKKAKINRYSKRNNI